MPSRYVAPKRLDNLEDVRKALQMIQEQFDANGISRARAQLVTTSTTLVSGEFVRLSPRQGALLYAKLPKATAENIGERIEISIERPVGTVRVSAERPDTVAGLTVANFTVAGLIILESNGVDQWVMINQIATNSPGQVTGPQGLQGVPGADGLQGEPGEQGYPGQTGAAGAAGTPGTTGADGRQGPPGQTFDYDQAEPAIIPGPAGAAGAAGANGATGAAGAQGREGPPGADLIYPDAEPMQLGLCTAQVPVVTAASPGVLNVAGVGPHNDLALPAGTTAIRFTSGATLTGIDSTGLPNGYSVDLFTSGGTAILTVTNNDVLSIAGNRIVTPGDEDYAAIRGGGRLVLDTIATTTVWRMSSSAGGLTPNLREIATAVASGNLGTINIATLTCGGTYRITSASGSFSIEGFTAKDVGFWFWFSYGEGAGSDSCTLFNEDVTASAANRLKLPGRATGNDMTGLELRGMFVYTGDLRWTWVGADPNRVGFNDANGVTVAANGAITLNTASTDIDLNSGGAIDLVTSPTTGVPVARLNGVPLGFCAEARLTTRTAVAASTTAANVVALTIPANFAVAGTSWRLQAHVRYDRTAAGVASNMSLVVDVGGTDVAIVSGATLLALGNNGSAKLDCILSFLAAPSAAAAYSVSCVMYNSIPAIAPVVSMTIPDPTLTVATNAALTIAVQVFFSVAAATNLTRTALMGHIQRVS